MADGKKPNGKSGGKDENKDVAKAAGFVVFSGIALSIIKALRPKKSIEEFVQSEDAAPSTSTVDTAWELKEDPKMTTLSGPNSIEKTINVQEDAQKELNTLNSIEKTSNVQEDAHKELNTLNSIEITSNVQEDAQKELNTLNIIEKTSNVQEDAQKELNTLNSIEKTRDVQKDAQKEEKISEVQKEVFGFGSEITKKFQKEGTTKKSSTTIELVKGDTLWDLSHKYRVSIDSIKAANGLADDMIYAGDKLIIPSQNSSWI